MITWWRLMITRGILEMMKMMMMKKRVKSCFCSFCFFFRICFDSSLYNIYYYNLINIFYYLAKLSLLTEIIGLLSGCSISTSTISFSFLLEKFLLKCSLIKYLHLIITAKNLIFHDFLKVKAKIFNNLNLSN